jgi:hypothetical protein
LPGVVLLERVNRRDDVLFRLGVEQLAQRLEGQRFGGGKNERLNDGLQL